LTRRFSKWKFKKNVKGTERENILQVHDLAQARDQRTASGVKITPAKRERWEKGLRKGVVQTTNLETTASSATNQVIIHIPKPSSLNNFNARVCSRVYPGATERPTSTTFSGSDTPELMGLHVRDTTHVGNEARQPSDWKHNLGPNSALEYSEPVIICGIFEALSLTPPEDITPFCQSMTTGVTKKARRKDYLSNGDLFEMTHRGGGNYFLSGAHITASSISSDPAEKNRLNQYPTVGVFWSPYTKRFTSPLSGELYPFPILDSAPDSVPKKSVGAGRLEELEWRKKLSKLESIFPETNSSVLKAVEKLADICFSIGKEKESEDLTKRLVMIKERENGPNSPRTLGLKLGLIETIVAQGRYCEAKNMLDDIHEVILRVDKPGGSLVQKSLQIMSTICVYFRNFGEAESILREVVQMRLIELGPRHGNTLAAIQRLSLPISLSGAERYSESEELLRIALEIGRNAPETSDIRKCRTTRSLANVLSFQGMHQESEALYRISVEFSEKSFGEDHPETLRCNFRLARELRQKGLFRESERLLERIARKQIERSGEYHPYTIDTIRALGDLLLETHEYEKAEPWAEKTLRGCRKLYSLDYARILAACDKLGECYEQQRRYQDALNLYERISREIGDVAGSDHPSIARLAQWLDWNRR
jgi:tetratricopeptide (TPR) repeat protein